MNETDAVIIGAGHNGLTCAAYLAMAGLRVRVVERRKVVGGAAVTEEFHPGFRNSVASYTVSLLNPEVIADVLRQFVLRAPPNLVDGFSTTAIREAFNAMGTANILRGLSLEQQRN